jgi:hypothetical protein
MHYKEEALLQGALYQLLESQDYSKLNLIIVVIHLSVHSQEDTCSFL